VKRLITRVRGILGTAATWAVAWIGLGAGIGAIAGFEFGTIVRIALSNAVGGFIAGATFAVILSVAERKSSLEDLSLKRVAIWGAAGGVLLSLIPLAYGFPVAYLLGPLLINGGIGAGMASGSVVLARRAEGRRLASGTEDALLGLEGG
jgi:hypothetical protein